MNRYKFAVLNNKVLDKKIFHFSDTGSVIRVIKYIKYCISNNGIFIADNISTEILNEAIIKICKYYDDVPLILESESAARAFSISYSYKNIFSYNNIPENKYINNDYIRDRYVICYDSQEKMLPSGIKSLVTIYSFLKE